jgi:hypothetical protein
MLQPIKGGSMVKATDVFTPTDVPTVTYVERAEKNYEGELRKAFDIPKMIVSISGPSKSGKTVLVTKVVAPGKSHPVWSKIGTA